MARWGDPRGTALGTGSAIGLGKSKALTVLRLELGPLGGEVVGHALSLFGLGPVLVHLVFHGAAHLLQVGLARGRAAR